MAKRIVNPEKAVRQLQNRVYDLEDDQRPTTKDVRLFVCTSISNFGDVLIGAMSLTETETETEARASAISACSELRNTMFCEAKNVKCESRVETQRI